MAVDLITETAELQKVCDKLAGLDWVALDTEFIREKTYWPQLCLIQLGTLDWAVCIDPLAVDINPLLDALYRPDLVKVLHAARQDLEIFDNLRGSVPTPVFDTQIAAPLLGNPDQMGYGNFVKERLGVELAKGHARTDWAARPLSDEQLEYAADDVRYLAKLYEPLVDELRERGRLAWLDDDFAALGRSETYRVEPEDAWRRLKGTNKFRGAALSILQALAAWREEQAQQRDKPRKWILSDDVLFALARLKIKNAADLGRIRGLPKPLIDREGEALIQLMNEARQREPQPLPEIMRPTPLTPAQEGAVDVLMGVLRLLAADADLHVSVLASRKSLERLVRGERELSLLEGWRRKFAGDTLMRVLDGEQGLVLEDGHLRLTPALA